MSESATQILSSCLNGSRDWLREATRMGLKSSDFAASTHQEIWQAIETLRDSGRGVRLGSVETELRGKAEASQDAKDIAARGQSFQTPSFHIECVMVDRLRLDALSALADTSTSLVGIEKVEDFQARARSGAAKLDALADTTGFGFRENTFNPVFDRTKNEMQDQFDAQLIGKAPWITTGLPALDRMTGGGWQRPGAYVVVGMSGRGKTHLGIHFALEAARAGSAVVYFTVEMPQSQIMRRIMANASGVPSSAIVSLNMTPQQFESIEAIPVTHSKLKLAIEDNFNGELDRVATLIRKYRRDGMLDVAVVDYVQQLVPPKRLPTKQQEMLAVASMLKQICIQEGIVMIQLAQANREAENAEENGVRLSAQHIEHSHAIYQNADLVAFFQTSVEEYQQRQEMLWIAKNRHGESGRAIPVTLDYELSRLRGHGP
jgi:replicative DNA helicase